MKLNVLAAVLMFLVLRSAFAQTPTESPPQEPPYTQEENEFEAAKKIESKATAPAQVTPPVPVSAEPSSAESSTEPVVQAPLRPESASPSPRPHVQYIQHPAAAKGLLRIEKDGTYVYKTHESSSFAQTGTLRIGTMDAPKITSKDGTTNFETMYQGSPVPIVMFDYEWQPFTSFGRLGIQGGAGFLVSQGNGRFACDPSVCGSLNGTEAKEKYTFIAVPLNIGGIYRLEWKDHQWVVPYVSGGGTYIPVVEMRDDSSSPHAVGTPGVYGAGGILFNISEIDHDTAFTLRNEYAIANLWLSTEYRYLKTFNEDIDFTSGIISLGIGIDY